MWALEPYGLEGEANSVVYLVRAPVSVGRPPKLTSIAAADVTVKGDSSVSKVHAQLQISTPPRNVDSTTRPEISVTDLSKFGTFVNNVKAGKQPPHPLKEGDIIRFGMKSKFRLKWVPIVLCLGPRLKLEDNIMAGLHASGMLVQKHWLSNCTHVVVDPISIDVDAIVACGLLSGCEIVAAPWVEAMVAKKVHVGRIPQATDFPTRLPLKTDITTEAMHVLGGLRLFWATSAEDPFSEALARLAGAAFPEPDALSEGSSGDVVAVYGGNGSPETSRGCPIATGCDWTNEKRLLDAVLTGNREGFRQPPVVATTLEQASVLSSDDEKDYSTSMYRDTMVATENAASSRSALGKRKATARDNSNPAPSLLKKKKQGMAAAGEISCPDTVPYVTDPEAQPEKDEEPAIDGNPDVAMESSKQEGLSDQKTQQQPAPRERIRGPMGIASILASVLDSDDEEGEMAGLDEFPVFVKPEGDIPVPMSGGRGMSLLKKTRGADNGSAAKAGPAQVGLALSDGGTTGCGVGQSRVPQTEGGSEEGRHQGVAWNPAKKLAREQSDGCALDIDGDIEHHRVEPGVTKGRQKSEEGRCPRERDGDCDAPHQKGLQQEQCRGDLGGKAPDEGDIEMVAAHREHGNVGDRCDSGDGGIGGHTGIVFESLIAPHRLRVSGKVGMHAREGMPASGVNYKTFVKIWPVASQESGPCFRGMVYKESGFDCSTFSREQQEKEKEAKLAEDLFANQVSSRIGLTGKSRVKGGRR